MWTKARILLHFQRHPDEAFTNAHFLAYGSRSAVDNSLWKLKKQGFLRWLQRGIYQLDAPGARRISMEELVTLKAARFGKRVAIPGKVSAEKLGLSALAPIPYVPATEEAESSQSGLQLEESSEASDIFQTDNPCAVDDVSEGMEGLEGPERAEGLEGLDAAKGLEALEALEAHNPVEMPTDFELDGAMDDSETFGYFANESNPDVVFLTDGCSSSFWSFAYNCRVYLRKASRRKVRLGNTAVGETLRALWSMGKQCITPEVYEHALKPLNQNERKAMRSNPEWIPIWLHESMIEILMEWSGQTDPDYFLDPPEELNGPGPMESPGETSDKSISKIRSGGTERIKRKADPPEDPRRAVRYLHSLIKIRALWSPSFTFNTS